MGKHTDNLSNEDQTTGAENKLQPNSVEMKIPASAEWVRVVRLATAGVAARLGFSYDDIEDLKLAVAEACNNAILHGASSPAEAAAAVEEGASVSIRWTIMPDRLKISVTDQGRLDEALQLPELPEGATDELPESGMGLILIQTLMDEVEHESGPHADTTLHMIKYAPPVRVGGTSDKSAPRPAGTADRKSASSRATSPRAASALSKALREN